MPKNITDKIYTIRGQKVMLDYDLAELYGHETKVFNRQVQRNIEKFEGEEFMFQLTKLEAEQFSRSQNVTLKTESNLMCKNCTSSSETEILRCQNGTSSWGGTRNYHMPSPTYEKGSKPSPIIVRCFAVIAIVVNPIAKP